MYYKKEQNMEYSETFHLKFSCHFDFTDYPFDSHECFMHYGSYDTLASEVTLTPPTISYREFVTRNGEKPMNLQGLPHVYEGAKYLDFFSSCSLKTREKYISFAKFLYFLREVCLHFKF